MQKFMFLIREDLERLDAMSPEQQAQEIKVMTAWCAELSASGNFLGGEPLASGAQIVSAKNVISDGPFIETKEGISGYLLITADSLAQAAEIAQGCPYVADGTISIEVRPVMQH